MSALVVTINGVRGCVQGAGGMVSRIERIQQAIRMVSRGRPSPLYEPAPGCCLMFPSFSAASDGPGVVVSLRGAGVQRELFA